ncbi:MAG TPA: adenosylmethionine--8-amino-7-oxononanoate transaminase [Sphingobacteriaceae bacterium]|nr:adenosylmethionine--8-amino-7-oxononanoate transaminase [Sphingobacteriaceae bacterium]
MNTAEKSIKYIWHPFTQMKDAEPPVAIAYGKGAKLVAEDGKEYIDAVSSWWVNIHGHAHPHIAKKLSEQAETLEHCMLAGFTHKPAVELAERLLTILPGLSKVFFSDNGSTAVEVGLKMAIQYRYNRGEEKGQIIALEHAYHGDTFGTMSSAARSPFSRAFDPYLFDVKHLPVPITGHEIEFLEKLETALISEKTSIFIYEPLILGAGGMLMYQPEVLNKALLLCKKYKAIIIADEVMTGFGRTGKLFASDHCAEKPDIICLSKGLTGGSLPMAITACNQKIYDAFLSSDKMKTFFHGHSFTGNPMGCAASLASLDILESRETFDNIGNISRSHSNFAKTLESNPWIKNIRQQGTILAFDVSTNGDDGYFNDIKDQLYSAFLAEGIILRPLGNTVYIMPPYCITTSELEQVYKGILTVLHQTLQQ